MTPNSQNEILVKIGNWISPRLDKYESIIALIFAVVVILKLNTDLKVGILLVLTLSTLSTLYFFNAYSFPDNDNAGGLERFVFKLSLLSGSVASVGILFCLQHWVGYDIMLSCGCITLAILLPVVLIIKSKKPDLMIFNNRLVIRIVVIAAIGLFLNFAPGNILINIGLNERVTIENVE
ncbi:MAG: hypothetical protein JXB49_37680 [Bacteroidales bacterium]|nr:hypothetical protein [Bacteroidales bacterium]